MADDIKLSGLGMIEASAGTGKTYTIQDLFFKLIAGCSEHPEGFPLESILVVTFTEAATMELKERIRQILTDGLMFFENPELLRSGPDPEEKKENGESEEYRRIKRLLEEARPGSIEDGKTRKTVELRIRKALISFDDAMIFTIHGFCQRMLQQYAFDSGILFDTEFCNDASIVDGLQDDFLRQELYPEKSALHQALLGGKSAILDAKLCRCVISRADLKLTETGCLDPREILNELETKLKELRDDFSPDKLPPEADEARTGFEDWCRAEGDIADSTTESVLEMLQRVADDVPAAPDESSFMENIHAVSFLKKKFLRILRYQAAVLIRDRFEKLKQKDNFQTFDDLLYRMKRALTGPGSQSMLAAIRKQFNAVFVDEFQDTDPVQYEIFKTLFGDPATGHILFFVGDPKQAIYSFRGGDIATYRKAKEYIVGNAGNICSLSRNFRSASLLVKSVNRLFSLWQPPEGTDQTVFADKDIPFKEVASGKAISTLTSADGKTDPNPLKFCWVEKAPGDETPKDHEKTLMKLCVRHIEKLLDSGWMIPGDAGGKKKPRPLHPGDIAVLVPENSDAILFRTLLNKRNIPCIVTKSENVFYTPAAKYLQTVLSAVLDYSDRRLNMEVMTTPLLGFPPEQVRDFCLDGNNSEFDRIQAALMRLNLIWEQSGFLKFFQEMLTEFNVRKNLLKLPLGGRILADLMHLQEQLHQTEMETGCKKEGLKIFLSEQISRKVEGDPPDALLTRRETDRSAVTLMTLHKSKGLEFPVVMLPLMFNKGWKEMKNSWVLYHNDEKDLCLSLDPGQDIIDRKKLEDQQECIRVLYVGLTRAKYACFLYWGDLKKKEAGEDKKKSRKSAKKESLPSNSLEWLFPDIYRNGFSRDKTYPQLEGCEILTDENISVPDRKTAEEKTDPVVLIEPKWNRRKTLTRFQYTSFSTLALEEIKTVSGEDAPQDSDGLDYDDTDDADLNLQKPEGIFKMPSGAAVGNAWHKIMEKIDFTSFDPDSPDDRALVEQELKTFGILRRNLPGDTRKEYVDLSLQMIGHVLNTPLVRHAGQPFSLNTIPMSDRLIEMKFNYSFRQSVSMDRVRAALARYAREKFGIDSLGIRDLLLDGGYLNGAIDLLFRRNGKLYIADWKSNRITGAVSGFGQDGLTAEIARHTYYFQYLIYTVAAMKYLGLHSGRGVNPDDYEQYFGGVYYFFLRGVDRNIPGQGVFFDRPSSELICNLNQLIG